MRQRPLTGRRSRVIALDHARWFGGVVAVEHRYIDAIIQGAIDDGLSTSGGRTVL
jgi:hypothetical protein